MTLKVLSNPFYDSKKGVGKVEGRDQRHNKRKRLEGGVSCWERSSRWANDNFNNFNIPQEKQIVFFFFFLKQFCPASEKTQWELWIKMYWFIILSVVYIVALMRASQPTYYPYNITENTLKTVIYIYWFHWKMARTQPQVIVNFLI